RPLARNGRMSSSPCGPPNEITRTESNGAFNHPSIDQRFCIQTSATADPLISSQYWGGRCRLLTIASCRDTTPMPHISLPEGLPGITSGFAFRPETAKPMRELAEVLLRGANTLTRVARATI